MSNFTPPVHPDRFLDWQLAPRRVSTDHVCPVCEGHGGWNIQPYAYPLAVGVPDTPENQYRRHFRASCYHCGGSGWVAPSQCREHQWRVDSQLGHCYTRLRCQTCSAVTTVDSGD